MASTDRCSQEAEIYIRFRPLSYRLVAVLGVLIFLLALLPGLGLKATLTGMGWGAVQAWLGFSLARRWRGVLDIGQRISYRRGKQSLDLPPGAARAVRISRRPSSSFLPTVYSLEVDIGDGSHELPFAEHRLLGNKAMEMASQIAETLGVPIQDPTGEKWRSSRHTMVRWQGRGEEWKIVLVALALVIALVLACLGAFRIVG